MWLDCMVLQRILLFAGLATKLAFNTTYHLQTNGQNRESQQDIGGHVEDVCDALSEEVGRVSPFG